MGTHKATIRSYAIKHGMESLYIHYYPPIRDKRTRRLVQKEVLGIYIYQKPKDEIEKYHNKNMMEKARAIHALRVQSLVNREYGFFDKHLLEENFLEYFAIHAEKKHKKWEAAFKHFYTYTKGSCKFKELDIDLCRGFREYLHKEAHQLERDNLRLNNNSASSYFNIFRAMLKETYRDKRIRENINEFLEPIKCKDTHREYLTLDEVKMLVDTPCNIPVLKAASMFAIMTGLRISDILELEWNHITHTPLGGWCIRLVTQKTKNEAIIPISNETLEWCGVRGEGKVFRGLQRSMTQYSLKKWISDAGITKPISFHCFRHTFATLQIAFGTDIYTVSKLLTHKHVATTEIYAKIVNDKKVESANRISLKSILSDGDK